MIRLMQSSDIPAMLAMGRMMHAESRYSHLDFSEDKLRRLGETILQNPNYFSVVVERDGDLIGMAIAYVTEHFFGHDLTSGDLAAYVVPSHRGGMAGPRMIAAIDAWYNERGVSDMLLGVSAGINADSIGRLYERFGYTDVFRIYRKAVSR